MSGANKVSFGSVKSLKDFSELSKKVSRLVPVANPAYKVQIITSSIVVTSVRTRQTSVEFRNVTSGNTVQKVTKFDSCSIPLGMALDELTNLVKKEKIKIVSQYQTFVRPSNGKSYEPKRRA